MSSSSVLKKITAMVTDANPSRHQLAPTTDQIAAASNNRKFLENVVVWPGPDSPGWINMHVNLKNTDHTKNGGKPFVVGWPYKEIDEFINRALWVDNTDKFFNVWLCMSQQSECGTGATGNPKAIRKAANATWVKAIWIDIDVKPRDDKHYQTQEAAIAALDGFVVRVGLPPPSAVINSGGGLHVYWLSDKPLTPNEWRPYAEGLKAALLQEGVLSDTGLTTDIARILRVPGTLNYKYDPPRPVELLPLPLKEYDFNEDLKFLAVEARASVAPAINSAFAGKTPFYIGPADKLSDGIERVEMPPLPLAPIVAGCAFIREAIETGGKDYSQPMWNLTTLAATFMEDGHALAHRMGQHHPEYSVESTDELWERKNRERADRDIGWPSCNAIQAAGCDSCATCSHFANGKSPLNLAHQNQQALPSEPSFVDPYAEFVGPEFPLDVLPSTLARFVNAEHRAMGADPSAIAMAALTAVAGAMHAETQVRMGEGWWEKPILWTVLLGQPSAMKSPIIDKINKPLSRIDHERSKRWKEANAKWLQEKKVDKTIAGPKREARCLINDATPEKIAEILSRDPSGSLMIQDELAGWLSSFERYNSGSSRAFSLSCWNGGTFTKDRVGKGQQDTDAEICVDNLALSILGGIQPDRLGKLGDLTSDGLLQRFLIVLMIDAERGDQDHPVADAEAEYERMIRSINGAAPLNYSLADDALEVRDRVLDYLHRLELVDGFPTSLKGAIGKLKGYFARICLVLQVACRHDPLTRNGRQSEPLHPSFTREARERLVKLFGAELSDCLSDGISVSSAISRQTAEAVEKILRDFLLPHTFGFYDVVVNGGQERDKLRTIANFILASDKDRLRPSDFKAGVRVLRGESEQKLAEWVGRFCGMDWLVAEQIRPGAPPKAWQVVPGLREHFAERRKQSQAARAEAHAILKAGGSRRKSP